MKIVLDTNVLVSGIFFAGPPAEILAACEAGRVTLVLTPEVVEEYRRAEVYGYGARNRRTEPQNRDVPRTPTEQGHSWQ